MADPILKVLSQRYLDARSIYEELNVQCGDAKAVMDEAETELLSAMNDAGLDSLKTESGVGFSRQRKVSYACLAENRPELLDLLEADGYRDMFTVSPNTLSALIKEKVSLRDDGEIPPEYAHLITEHEEIKLSVRGRKKG